MASDPDGLYILGFILLLFAGVAAYAFLSNRRSADRQKHLIRAFKASPAIAKDAPILVQGRAQGPDLILPTTGEHVAYYGLFVLSAESAITGTHTGGGIRINGIPLGTDRTQIDAVRGFMFFETSGDFTVASGGSYFSVRPSGIFAYFKKGADLVSGLVAGQFKSAGMPDGFFEDTMNFSVAEQALKVLCGFEAPLVTERSKRINGSWNRQTTTQRTRFSVVTATSRIDTRVHHFIAGSNLPQGIADLVAKRGIELPDKEEVIVIETFIPLSREVFVFGTFDGDRGIVFADRTVQLSVSYADPGGE